MPSFVVANFITVPGRNRRHILRADRSAALHLKSPYGCGGVHA